MIAIILLLLLLMIMLQLIMIMILVVIIYSMIVTLIKNNGDIHRPTIIIIVIICWLSLLYDYLLSFTSAILFDCVIHIANVNDNK